MPARSIIGLVALTAHWCTAEALPAEIARRIAEGLRPIRRYTCLETIHRTRVGEQCSDCTVHDRLRMQVLFADGQEFTAWPGDGRFEAVTADHRVSDGMVVLGHFAGMAGALFLKRGAVL